MVYFPINKKVLSAESNRYREQVMKKSLTIIIVLLLGYTISSAKEITGEGYGSKVAEAKKEALADLSQNIKVETQSVFSSIIKVESGNVEELKKKIIHLKSDLPILGAEFNIMPMKDQFFVKATLDFKSLQLYENELINMKKVIDHNGKKLATSQGNAEKKMLLSEILTNLDMYDKYRIVAQFMGSQNIPEINVTKAEVKKQIILLTEKADTLDFGLKALAQGITENNIFIYPPTTRNSREITEFACAVKNRLSAYLHTVENPMRGKYFLSGEYQIAKDRLDLTYHMLTADQDIVKTFVTTFSESAYQDYEIEPHTLDFDNLLKNGVVVSGDLSVKAMLSSGKRDLLFFEGDPLKIMIKMNRPGYFYIVVHTLKKEEKYSYMLDFFTSHGNRKFIYHVNVDDVNKWIALPEFEVVPPFGVETLQVIASTNDLMSKVPSAVYDPKTKLYKISDNPSKAVALTRGLIRKERKEIKDSKPSIAETTLMFTTSKRATRIN
jgi:ribosomal protein L10